MATEVNDLTQIIDSTVLAKQLQPYFSERALMSSRIFVEVQYLLALSTTEGVGCRAFSNHEKDILEKLHEISAADFAVIKAIETKGYQTEKAGKTIYFPKTDHDVKAIEYFMQLQLTGTTLQDCFNWIHFGLTSEDVNNLATTRNMQAFLKNVYVPAIDELLSKFNFASTSPSAGGNGRIKYLRAAIDQFEFTGKLLGASGNLNAHAFSFPAVDWIDFSRRFVESLGVEGNKFKANMFTTQVEPKDNYARLFQLVSLFNTIASSDSLQSLESKDYFSRSSALFEMFTQKLPRSRLQRDLSDSTVQRNFGVAFGYSMLGLQALAGKKVQANTIEIIEADAISPLVGRYRKQVDWLENHSKFADAINIVYVPQLQLIINHLDQKVQQYALLPMLARTHGQAATPTTMGKEYRVFTERLGEQKKELDVIIKNNSPLQTAELSHCLSRINTIIADLAVDFWIYIKDEWILQKNVGTTGSSTMPHKINPINFENAEGNTYLANALFPLVAKGDYALWKEAVGYSLVTITSLFRGLDKTTVNEQKVIDVLHKHPEVLAEAYQTELRKPEYGIADPYGLLKTFTQGKGEMSLKVLHSFVDSLEIPAIAQQKLKQLVPDNYLGVAGVLARKEF